MATLKLKNLMNGVKLADGWRFVKERIACGSFFTRIVRWPLRSVAKPDRMGLLVGKIQETVSSPFIIY